MNYQRSVTNPSSEEKLLQSVPSRYYTDPALFQQDKEKIFYRTWQYMAHVSEVVQPGDFITRRIIDQEFVITRDNDGKLHCFYNVCQHRGHTLTKGDGNCKLIVCPYHAWSYRLDGSLNIARNAENVPGFDKSAIHLNEVQLEEFCGFIFVNMKDDAPSLKGMTGDLEQEILEYVPYIRDLRMVGETLLNHSCNWKVTTENFNECYHCAVVHKTYISKMVALDKYRVIPNGITLRHYSVGHPKEVAAYKYDPLHGGKGDQFATWYIWPNVAISCFPGGIVSVRHFRPLEVRKTVYAYQWFRDAATPEQDVKDLMQRHHDTNGMEDLAIVNGVQEGLESNGYDIGPLLVDRERSEKSEHGVAHVQALYREAIGLSV
jgi:phenylpropionate dioxygenase-like ring-hydroxylating dioxygenase large terminal subunit